MKNIEKTQEIAMSFKVGVGKVDITPNHNAPTQYWCLGNERSRITSFPDQLYAKTIALSDGRRTVTVTSLDVACLYKIHHDAIRKIARQTISAPIDEMFLHNTHQHSDSFNEYEEAYDLFGVNDQAFDLEYCASLPKRIANSIALAVQDMRPALVGYGSGAVEEGIASCRRVILEDGKLAWRGSRPDEAGRSLPRGHIDPEVGVVSFVEPDGKAIATLVNYACHPSAAGGDSPTCCSADYPGFATRMIDQLHGGTSIFLHGCSGDINPGKYVRGDRLENKDRIADAKRMGQILAGEVIKTLGLLRYEEVAYLNAIQEETALPVKAEAGDQEECLKNAKEAVERMRQTRADPRTALRKYIISRKIKDGQCPVNMGAVAINNLALSFMPGEPFTSYGQQIKAASMAQMTMVASTCGQDPFYIPTPEAIAQGGYETNRIASVETGIALVAQAKRLLKEIVRQQM